MTLLPFSKAKITAFLFPCLLLTACGGSSSGSGSGYYQLYNASYNAPKLYLTIDDYDYSGLSYGAVTSFYEYDTGDHDIEVSRQQDDDSTISFFSETFKTNSDKARLLVVTGDINDSQVLNYEYEIENPDDEDAQFTFHLLDLAENSNIEVYISKDNETINEAQLIGQYGFGDFSDSQYFTYDDSYKFYIKNSDADEVVYTSPSIYFGYTSQYVIAVRDNDGVGSSPYTLDKIAQSNFIENYADANAAAQYNVYNGINTNDLLPEYHDIINFDISGTEESPDISDIEFGQLSQTLELPFGDYQMSIMNESNTLLAQNQKLSLNANQLKTVFFYQTVELANLNDEDNTNDETKLYVNAIKVTNSNHTSVYEHQIKLVNLIDDYDGVNVYFVQSDETIDTAQNTSYSAKANPTSLTLLNNTYQVHIVAKEDNTELILASDTLTLSEDSSDLFLVMIKDEQGNYKLDFLPQNQDIEE